MIQKERAELDHQLTTPPETCEEVGHRWVVVGRTDDDTFLKCKRCGKQSEG